MTTKFTLIMFSLALLTSYSQDLTNMDLENWNNGNPTDWFLVKENEVRSLFDHDVTFHDIIGNCSLSTEETIASEKNKAIVYPNPCGALTTLKFDTKGEFVSIFLINLQGQKVKPVYEGTLTPSTHHIPIDMNGLDNGNYQVVIITPNAKQNVSLIKL